MHETANLKNILLSEKKRWTQSFPQYLNSSVPCDLNTWIYDSQQDFSLLQSIQSGSGAHPASYQVGTGGYFLRVKAPGVWSSPTTHL
jgi:hypothetical protein